MAFPAFFERAPGIQTHDPLAEFLGASNDGRVDYAYADAVRVAGHSCPTVAGAFLMARAALRALYPDRPAERGDMVVTMSSGEGDGTTGVIAQIFTLVTGAAAENGFHGLGGRFERRNLLRYDGGDRHAIARVKRRDNGIEVGVGMDLAAVPASPGLRDLLDRAIPDDAAPEDRNAFAAAWQDRVRRLLLDYADDTRVIQVERYA